jgi:hypothetical protein
MKYVGRELLLTGDMVHSKANPPKRSKLLQPTGALRPRKRVRLSSAAKKANAEYRDLVRYLRFAIGILPKAECQLLMEFVDLAQRKRQQAQGVRPCSRPANASQAPEE